MREGRVKRTSSAHRRGLENGCGAEGNNYKKKKNPEVPRGLLQTGFPLN